MGYQTKEEAIKRGDEMMHEMIEEFGEKWFQDVVAYDGAIQTRQLEDGTFEVWIEGCYAVEVEA